MTDAMRAETVMITGAGGDEIETYLAQPLDGPPTGGVVVIHHMPGSDEQTKEITRTFAVHGYLAVCPDERLVGDVGGAAAHLRSLSSSNGKVATIGYCSGGRQSFLAACSLPLDAAVDCYGAFIINPVPEGLPLKVQPIGHLAKDLSCPLLGLFGSEDQHPSPAEVAELEKILADNGKTFSFHSYEGAGHAFFATNRPSYRPEAANDGWERIFTFFGRYLSS
jgi:carboxymethylenebutenolidase